MMFSLAVALTIHGSCAEYATDTLRRGVIIATPVLNVSSFKMDSSNDVLPHALPPVMTTKPGCVTSNVMLCSTVTFVGTRVAVTVRRMILAGAAASASFCAAVFSFFSMASSIRVSAATSSSPGAGAGMNSSGSYFSASRMSPSMRSADTRASTNLDTHCRGTRR